MVVSLSPEWKLPPPDEPSYPFPSYSSSARGCASVRPDQFGAKREDLLVEMKW